MSTTFNILDLIFLALTLVFVITAFLRGFVREVFALLNWIMALGISHLITPVISHLFYSYSTNTMVIDVVIRLIIFIFIFIATAMTTSKLRKAIKEKIPTSFDTSLGVFYGLLKSVLIFGFIYSLMTNLYGFALDTSAKQAAKKLPLWAREAKTYRLISFAGETIDPIVKTFFDSVAQNFDRKIPRDTELDSKIDKVLDKEINLDNFDKEKIDDIDSKRLNDTLESDAMKEALENSGYDKRDIQKMNRLIEIVQ